MSFHNNTHITKTQPGSLTRKGIAMCSFLQVTNYGLLPRFWNKDHFTLCKIFQRAILNTATMSLTAAVDPQQPPLLKYTKLYQLDHPKQNNYCGRK